MSEPVQNAFKTSTLQLETHPVEQPVRDLPWQAEPVNSTAALIFIVLVMLNVRNFMETVPAAAQGLWHWRYNFKLESSIHLARARNICAVLCCIPFCLSANRYEFYAPVFLSAVPSWASMPITVAVGLGYYLLRLFLAWQFQPRRQGLEAYRVANRAYFSMFVLQTITILLIGMLLSMIGMDAVIMRKLCWMVLALFYGVFLVRKCQILSTFCNPFTTFLYLCALELIPSGLLAASAVLL